MAKPKSLPYEAPEAPDAYHVTLHSQVGGSDKIYKLAIEPAGGGLWMLNYANGRRGATLTAAPKIKEPASYAEVRKACNATLFSKVGDGYVPVDGSRFGDGMTAEAIATQAREASGHLPQLPNPIEEDDLDRYLDHPDYVAQRKHNGERRLLIVQDGKAVGGNRRGQTVALSRPIREAAESLGRDVVLDGEQIGDTFHFWDVLHLNGTDLRGRPLHERLLTLAAGDFQRGTALRLTETASSPAEKRRLLDEVRATAGEGIVLKHRQSAYEPGKAGSKATWHKFKLWASLSAIVARTNSQRSVGLELVDGEGGRVEIGNVTIPANHKVPAVGDVVEVRYLYAFDGGALHQPSYEGPRADIDPSECLASQRRFHGGEAAPALDEEEPSGLRM